MTLNSLQKILISAYWFVKWSQCCNCGQPFVPSHLSDNLFMILLYLSQVVHFPSVKTYHVYVCILEAIFSDLYLRSGVRMFFLKKLMSNNHVKRIRNYSPKLQPDLESTVSDAVSFFPTVCFFVKPPNCSNLFCHWFEIFQLNLYTSNS